MYPLGSLPASPGLHPGLHVKVCGGGSGKSWRPDWKLLARIAGRKRINSIAKARRFRLKSLVFTREQTRKSAIMDIIQELEAGILSHSSMAVIAVVGIVALILAIKVAHFLIRLLLGLIALAAIGGGVWSFFLRP